MSKPSGNTVDFEGCIITIDREADIRPGDTYLASRNIGPQLLTCDHIAFNAVFPVEEFAYTYYEWECVKVVAIDGEPV